VKFVDPASEHGIGIYGATEFQCQRYTNNIQDPIQYEVPHLLEILNGMIIELEA
jgi:hypothetical protein